VVLAAVKVDQGDASLDRVSRVALALALCDREKPPAGRPRRKERVGMLGAQRTSLPRDRLDPPIPVRDVVVITLEFLAECEAAAVRRPDW
jgi:hypothetical protein